MDLSLISKAVINNCARDNGVKPADVTRPISAAGRSARAQLWQSCRETGWTLEEIADRFESQAPTVYRSLQRYYPALYKGRG